MIFIHKISSHSAIDYAAEELRKYLLTLAFAAWILTLEKITASTQNVIEADN